MATQNLTPVTQALTNAKTIMDAATLAFTHVPALIAKAVADALAADPGATGTEIQTVVDNEVAAVNTAATSLSNALLAGTPPGTANL